jgi:uncharacterized membrane protein HdeD (DUF308 family)
MHLENRIWGGIALRGVLAILFGVVTLVMPGAVGTSLIYLFGAYAIIDGVFALVASAKLVQIHERWWAMLLVGLVGIAAGVYAFARPTTSALAIVYLIAAWAIITGLLEEVAAFRLRKVVDGEWMLAVAGLVSIAFGLMLAARPGAGLIGLLWVIGAYAIIFGVLLIGLAFRLRGVDKHAATT